MAQRVLIVEDDPSIREGISDLLTLEGFEVQESSHGREGLEKIKTYSPDIVLSDIIMPEMDGYTFLQEYQKMQSGSNIPFVFMSALSERYNIRTGMNLGADDYLTKPFSNTELLQSIKSQCVKNKRREISLSEKYEARLKEVSTLALLEKEAILKELHHRVKNNMAFIYALFEMHDQPLKQKQVESIKNRIFSLAAVHEEAYANEMLSTVDTKNLLANILDKFTPDHGINIIKNISPITLNLTEAIPLGLLFHEMLTNALNHAFHDTFYKEITIEFYEKSGKKNLLFEDNGCGFMESQKSVNTGLLLIDLLTAQLNGSIEKTSTSEQGTSYLIQF
ncbi:response regulator [Gracilimonas sp.]|uniref:response regulator n=1 Tax=Gracilimonas sp. TaxID=1974203 RepID=UPI003BAB9E96